MRRLPPGSRMVEVVFSRRPAFPVGAVERNQLGCLIQRQDGQFFIEVAVSLDHHIKDGRIAQRQRADLLDKGAVGFVVHAIPAGVVVAG